MNGMTRRERQIFDIDKILEMNRAISSTKVAKTNTTANTRIKNTYSGRYDFRITEINKYISAIIPIFKNVLIN